MRLHFFTNYFPLKFWHYKQTFKHANLRSTIKILLVCVCTRVPYSIWWNKRNSCLLDFFDSIFFYLNTSCVSRAKKSEVQSLRETCTQVQKGKCLWPTGKTQDRCIIKKLWNKAPNCTRYDIHHKHASTPTASTMWEVPWHV